MHVAILASFIYILSTHLLWKNTSFSFLSLLSSLFLPYGCWGWVSSLRFWVILSWNAKIGSNLHLGCVDFAYKSDLFCSPLGIFLWETAMPALVNYRGQLIYQDLIDLWDSQMDCVLGLVLIIFMSMRFFPRLEMDCIWNWAIGNDFLSWLSSLVVNMQS